MRVMLAVIACVVLLAGCGGSETAGAESLSAADVADVSARAAQSACEQHCDGAQQVYVLALIVTPTSQAGDEPVMPVETQQALMARMDRTEIITEQRHEGMVVDGLPVDPHAAIVYVGPVNDLGDGLVEIDIGVMTARDGFRSDTYLYRSTGDGWEPTTPEQSGVTVTSAVS